MMSPAARAAAAALILTLSCGGKDNGGRCGNDRIDEGEVCDGRELGTAPTCLAEGFRGGEVACAEDCQSHDLSGCSSEAVCGNGTVEFPEECDGFLPEGAGCGSRGFDRGTVSCSDSCTLDVRGCVVDYCGDGTRNGSEECDGTDTGGTGCVDLGFSGGGLACGQDCSYDPSGCTGGCGNGVAEGAELCDGSDVGSRTCADEGFPAGLLGCAGDCSAYDTSRCASPASPCTTDGAPLGEMGAGDVVLLAGTTEGASDDIDLGCQFDLPVPMREVVHEILVMQRGRLHAMARVAWHVVGLMEDARDAGGCFVTEVACGNPFLVGNSFDLGNVDPGRYHLVVSDWNDVSIPYEMVVSLVEPDGEVCANGGDDDWDGQRDCADPDCTSSPLCGGEASCTDTTDEDLDGLVDCADTDCVGSADCVGSSCATDEDLGTLVPYTPAGSSVDVSASSNDLTLSCSASDGPDHVYRFTLASPARILVSLDQAASTAHAVGLTFEAGASAGCTDAEHRCLDLSESTDTPDLFGWFSAEPFPAGTYHLVIEGTATGAGDVSTSLTAYDPVEADCADGTDNDGDDATDCGDFDCIGETACTGSACTADHDLGSLGIGETVTHTADTSAGTSTLNLGCSPSDGPDLVYSVTLVEPAFVWIDVDQEPGSGHATAIAFEGGPAAACNEVEHLCIDITDVDTSPDAYGYLTVDERLPAGTYLVIHEATAGGGEVRLRLSAAAATLELDCHDGQDNDADGDIDCADPQCRFDTGCTGRGVWELFDGTADAFDLAGTMLTLTPVPGHPDGYVWATRVIPELFPVPPGSGEAGQTLALGDDDTVEITLSVMGGGFPFYGESHGVLAVSSNGLLTLGAGTSTVSFSESVETLFEQPSVALLWDDLNPEAGGTITHDEFADRTAVSFDAVPETDPVTFEPVGQNSFQGVLWDDGHLDIAWLGVSCADGLVGISDGSAIVNVTPEKDLN